MRTEGNAAATTLSLCLTSLKKGERGRSERLTCVNVGLPAKENTPSRNGGTVGTPATAGVVVRQEHLTIARVQVHMFGRLVKVKEQL